jgi:hypothetical protein
MCFELDNSALTDIIPRSQGHPHGVHRGWRAALIVHHRLPAAVRIRVRQERLSMAQAMKRRKAGLMGIFAQGGSE